MFYNVIVTHDDTDPIITSKEIYEKAIVIYSAECKNAAGYLTNKPGKRVLIELKKPDGDTDRCMVIQS